MGDDFEKAVLFSFDQSGEVSNELRNQAQALLLNVSNSADAWHVCVTHLEGSQYMEVQFWCLQTLHSIIQSSVYDELEGQAKEVVKRLLLSIALPCAGQNEQSARGLRLETAPAFLKNKVAQVIVAIAGREYPSTWPGFFQEILTSLNQSPVAIDMFCRILLSVHEDIISLEVPRSAEEAKQSMAFKDAMREHALSDIAVSWCQILAMFKDSSPDIVVQLLNAVERYVPWIDIGLVANDSFMSLLFSVLECQHAEAQSAAVGVLAAIVNKRMDSGPKLSLIQNLGIVPIVASWSETGIPGMKSDEHELAVVSSKLLTTLATEVLEAWKKVENSVLSVQAVGLAVEQDAAAEATATCAIASGMMDQLFPTLVSGFGVPDEEICETIAPFMLSYIARVRMISKRNMSRGEHTETNGMSRTLETQVLAILEAVAVNARFADDSSVYPVDPASAEEEVISQEEESNVAARRHETFTLFRNGAKLIPSQAYELVAKRMDSCFNRGANANVSWQDAELALSLLYQVGEGATEMTLKPNSGPLADLAAAVISIDDSIAYHRLVALALLEGCARYAKAALHQQGLIPLLAGKFFGQAGLGHPSSSVPPRAAYLLCRVTKTLKSQMNPIARDIIRALIPHLNSIATTPLGDTVGLIAAGASSQTGASGAGISGADDRMYAFEAAGILVGAEEFEESEQVEWLKTLWQPLVLQMKDLSSQSAGAFSTISLLQQAIEAVTRISKGFSPKLCASRSRVAELLTAPLEPAMKTLQAYPGSKHLRLKFLAYVHRLVECLGSNMTPHLSTVLWSLQQTGNDAGDFKDVMVLLNQMVLKFSSEGLVSIIEMIVPECIGKVHTLLGGDEWDWSGARALPAMSSSPATFSILRNGPAPIGSTEDLREKAELQKSYFTFLHSLSVSNLGDVLLNPNEATALMDLMKGSATHVDPGVRKLCIATLGKLALQWTNGGSWSRAVESSTSSAPVPVQGSNAPRHSSQVDTKLDSVTIEGLKEFLLNQFGCEVLLESLTVKVEAGGVDIRDAAAISLLTEVSTQMKSMHSIGGDEYLSKIYQCSISKLGWPHDVGEQLAQHIAQSGTKELKDYLKALLLEYRKMS